MALEKYTEKRTFEKTPEPKGDLDVLTGNRFVIHKHEARRTHYDFRIELDGVLVCWAIPKMPVLIPR
ncbi:MAG: hypothetical protein HC906_03425 [Bacteroidales bacterium]|nr:hypothetical protein [Bacteroidales bacterium]